MSFIRPEITRWLTARAEPLTAAAALILSVWLAARGGFALRAVAGVAALGSAVWLIGALRRQAFRREIAAPGLVEIDEGAIRYFDGAGGVAGGQVALRELVEIRLIRLGALDHWRLRTADGQALLIPLEAAGAARLADAFAALPGLDMGRVAAALSQKQPDPSRIVWTRP
ncbi:MAG: hypothetical protein Q4G36_11455 [Paracoccus sp. (in: a-proteobacteria)]|nr:hypothetical protein [Paracoccus sp. (in: a-proteobacteria)]